MSNTCIQNTIRYYWQKLMTIIINEEISIFMDWKTPYYDNYIDLFNQDNSNYDSERMKLTYLKCILRYKELRISKAITKK